MSGARKFILLFYIYRKKKPQLVVSLLLTLCLILECRPKQLSNSENSKKKLRRKKRIKNGVIIREKQKKGKKKERMKSVGLLAYLLYTDERPKQKNPSNNHIHLEMRTRPEKKEETNSLFLSFFLCVLCTETLFFPPLIEGKVMYDTESQHTDGKTSEKVIFSFLPDECCVYLGLGLSLSYFFQELSLLSVRIYVSNWNPGKMELAVT